MDFNNLEYIVTLAEERNISRAARKLLITQSALSQYLLNLEKGLGVPLFNRVQNQMTLTYAGEIYLASVKEILHEKMSTRRKIQDMTDYVSGELTFGVGFERGLPILPHLFQTMGEKCPGVMLKIIQNNVRQLEYLTQQGTIDVSLLSFSKKEPDLDFERLCQEEMVLVVPNAHPLASLDLKEEGQRQTIDLGLARNESFVVTSSGLETRKMINTMFQEAGFDPKIILETESIVAVYDTAISSSALCIVPETIISHKDPLRKHACFSIDRNQYSWQLAAAYRRGAYVTRAARQLMMILKEYLLSLVQS